jgi:hypothetical protein
MGSVLLIFLVFCVSLCARVCARVMCICVCVCVCSFCLPCRQCLLHVHYWLPPRFYIVYLDFFIYMHGFFIIVPFISYCPRLIAYCVDSIKNLYLYIANRIGSVMVSVLWYIFSSSPDRVKPKTIALVCVASPLSMQH